jgi:hypothetical protein
MLARLRRLRWIAAFLIAASPALAGVVLPVLHPCPVDFPGLAAAASQQHQTPAAAHGSSHQDEHHPVCHCPGCSQTPQLTLPAFDAPVAVLVDTPPTAPTWLVVERIGDAVPVLEYLPETTAPPVV